ncbi:hypothetical protein LR48_Vigan03g049900 [Vigna angularis]|uniref:Uncharacterized protein n=1 Tax=Phaseolus angularis TaxID=3914 RepID=A0A0L9U2Q7_PHAAN|nr:hypothetical protein LR48_Vigan03g049900 [Vigna angularis]
MGLMVIQGEKHIIFSLEMEAAGGGHARNTRPGTSHHTQRKAAAMVWKKASKLLDLTCNYVGSLHGPAEKSSRSQQFTAGRRGVSAEGEQVQHFTHGSPEFTQPAEKPRSIHVPVATTQRQPRPEKQEQLGNVEEGTEKRELDSSGPHPEIEQPVLDSDTNSPEEAVDDLEIGKELFNEQKQVYSEPDIPITLPDLHTHSNACDLTHIDSIGFVTDTDTDLIDHFKIFNSVSAIEPIGKSRVNIDFERETVQSDDFIELGLNFDLTQFSENFECDCESGSRSSCAEIDYALHPDSMFITDAINCEFDDKNAELKENAGDDIKEFMIDEEEYTATCLSEPEISIPVSHTQQLLVEGEILLKQITTRRILMKQFFLKFSLLNPVIENISLLVQVWQLPP